jgi:hypothetical protein
MSADKTSICVIPYLLTCRPPYLPCAELVKNFASSILTLSQGYFTEVPDESSTRRFLTQVHACCERLSAMAVHVVR